MDSSDRLLAALTAEQMAGCAALHPLYGCNSNNTKAAPMVPDTTIAIGGLAATRDMGGGWGGISNVGWVEPGETHRLSPNARTSAAVSPAQLGG